MKVPKWLRQEIAEQGAAVVHGTASHDAAVTTLTDRALAKDPDWVRRLVADCVAKALQVWTSRHGTPVEDGDQLELFPDLPAHIEIAPGRFVAQASMTRQDWTAAIRQARTKADNAAGHADRVEAIAQKVLPLLTADDLTTGEVWPPAAATGTGPI